jgi:type VI secretion system protein
MRRETISSLRWLLFALLLVQGACTVGLQAKPVRLVATPDVNSDQPLTVEIVSGDGAGLIAKVSALTAQDWFSQRTTLLKDYPNDIRSSKWEILPGMGIEITLMHRPSQAIFLFANYAGPGEHRLRLDTFNQPIVRLGKYRMEIVEQK